MDLFQKSLPSADVCEFALLFLSSTLIGTNKNELFVNFEGTGGNGKGVITTLHDNSLGDYAGILDNSYITNISNSQEGHNSKLISIFKKRYVQVNEPPNEKKLNIDFIKEITGGDKIQIRKAHSPNPELTDIPKFTLVMLCNKMPKIEDVHDGGFIRRYVGINFPNRFVMHEPKKVNEFRADPNLKPKLKDNIQYRQQYMLILLDYVKMYIANNQKLVIPQLVSMNSSRMLKNQDSYSEFLEEQIEITENACDGIIIRDLFSMFKDYYQEHISGGKRSPITQTEFIEKMKTCFANYEVEFKNNIKIGGLSRGKGFTGIKVRDEADDSEE
jgi:phage/plasmid-associated DNA primase